MTVGITILRLHCEIEVAVQSGSMEIYRVDEKALLAAIPHGSVLSAKLIKEMPIIDGEFTRIDDPIPVPATS